MDTTNTITSPGTQNAIDLLNAPSTMSSQNQLATLDQTDFLRLLTTQLTLQDPLEPTSNEDMLAQMAQFSSLQAQTDSSSSLNEISTKLDALIEAQEAATAASTAATQAATQAAEAATAAVAQIT